MASTAVKQFDPAKVQFWVGENLISGTADGTFISATRLTDTWADAAGADGEVVRIKSNDRRGTITLTLIQSSSSNDIMSALAVSDEEANIGARPIFVKDGTGSTILMSAYGWIVKPADVTYYIPGFLDFIFPCHDYLTSPVRPRTSSQRIGKLSGAFVAHSMSALKLVSGPIGR